MPPMTQSRGDMIGEVSGTPIGDITMAKDADGNYYYEAGTIAAQFDEWGVYEDSDGNVGFLKNGNELRLHEAGHVFGDQRAEPTSDEIADGERMLFVGDGSDATSAGVLYLSKNDGDTITTVPVSTGTAL